MPKPQEGQSCTCEEKAHLLISWPGGSDVRLDIENADPNAVYDLYYLADMNVPSIYRAPWRNIRPGIQCDGQGRATAVVEWPNWGSGYFLIFDATDTDGDGLSNGYECWFHYTGVEKTCAQSYDSDDDNMKDGWEVEYGLNPKDAADGGTTDSDSDGLSNPDEHYDYYHAIPGFDATFDPKKAAPTQRPVMTLSPLDAPTMGFRVNRDVGQPPSKPLQAVYFGLGGTAVYDVDYNLDPQPTALRGMFSASVPSGADSITFEIQPTATDLAKGALSIVVAVTPFAPAIAGATPGLTDIEYVIDWNRSRLTNNFAGGNAGILINLFREAGTGYLKINSTTNTTPLPFVNLAASGNGSMIRIEVPNTIDSTTATRILGEYWTAPAGSGYGDPVRGNPSRTTVDRYGNVWVANREVGLQSDDSGSIVEIGLIIGGQRGRKIGGLFVPDEPGAPPGDYVASTPEHPIIYNTCVDRDHDGYIHTYGRDANGTIGKIAWNDASLPAGDGDEAIIHYIRTTAKSVRTVAVDANNYVWAGSGELGWHELIDSIAGAPITGQKIAFGTGGYGGVIDPWGTLWSPGHGYGGLMRYAPSMRPNTWPLTEGTIMHAGGYYPASTGYGYETVSGYGIGLDPVTGDVWMTDYESGGVWQFTHNPQTHRSRKFMPYGAPAYLKGLVVDASGTVWTARAGSPPDFVEHELVRFNTSGQLLGSVDLSFNGHTGRGPHGVCIDSAGKIWAICEAPSDQENNVGFYAMRIDPNTLAVIEEVDLGNYAARTGPYNYSDMTGFVDLTCTQPAGVWDFVQDSGLANTVWHSLTYSGTANGGSISVEVRAANAQTELTAWPFHTVTGGIIPAGVKGRYLEVRFNLLRAFGTSQDPTLMGIALGWGAPGSDVNIIDHPKSATVAVGDPIPGPQGSPQITVNAIGDRLRYQWYHDGSPVSGATTTSLAIPSAAFSDAGRYQVRVTDAGGAFIDSADARLHVNSTPDTLASTSAEPTSPNLGDSVTLTATMNVLPTTGPFYYQWRKNGVPIANASSSCAPDINGLCTAQYTINPVRCQDSASYSAVFISDFWRVASPSHELVVFDSGTRVQPVHITPVNSVPVPNPSVGVILTADSCISPDMPFSFSATSYQWYQVDSEMGEQYGEHPIVGLRSGENSRQLLTPTPIYCNDHYTVYTFDEGGFPYPRRCRPYAFPDADITVQFGPYCQEQP